MKSTRTWKTLSRVSLCVAAVLTGIASQPASGAPVVLAAKNTPKTDLAEPSAKVAPTRSTASPHAIADQPTYLRDVLPILMGKCATCHNNQLRLMYNWMDYKTAFTDRWEIKRRVWDSCKGRYFKQAMPAGNSPEALAMTEAERKVIKDWVEGGAPLGVRPKEGGPKSKTERIALGQQLFGSTCVLCHQASGQGVPNVFPPLANSDYLNADKDRAIQVLLRGRQGEIVVNGQTFNNSMPQFPFTDEDIANALTYVYNSFGNSGREVTPEEVKALRAQKEEITKPDERGIKVRASAKPSQWE